MIRWLESADPERPFLVSEEGVLSYGEAAAAVRRRIAPEPVILRPEITIDSALGLLAGMAGGGVVALGPGVEDPTDLDLAGAALVVFTSGTAGIPKGVRLTLANLAAAARASVEHLGHGPEDIWLLALPLHHVAGISILVRSAYAGGTVRILPGFDPAGFAAALREVTLASVVPTMLARLLGHDPGPYTGVRSVLVGGGSIPAGLLERAASAGLPVLPTYGMTESFGQVATLSPGAPLAYRAHPLPGVEIRIEDDGRVAVKGPQVSPGYLAEPDREDPWLVSNDLGEVDEEGALRILGRADTVIVTGGENVDPSRVETELLASPGVDEVMVVGVPDPEWGMVVGCVYAGEASPDELEADLKARLPVFMVPKRWLRVESIPRTSLGKPDRSVARALVASEPL
jgi:O-succinylbenzoic acid--CoA ligase